jgi:cysteine-S-conjugate beta-lyase
LKELFDFDHIINREVTASLKYDGRENMFGDASVIPLWVADMDFATPIAVTKALADRANHPIYGYSAFPESMLSALIDWLNLRHGWHIKREWIVMCPGIVPSLHAAITALTDDQDAVIIQPPVYFPFFSAVTDTGRNLMLNTLRFENNQYGFDFENFEECSSQASMLLLCSPHNPVGRVWRQDELKQLLGIAEKYNLIIVADEVHADLVYPEAKHCVLEPLSAYSKNIITAVAPSKTFNIPGLNLSALIIPDPQQRAKVSNLLERSHVSAANPFSIVAFEAAYKNGADWLDALIIYLKETCRFVIEYIRDYLPKIRVIQPEGSYLLWLDCRGLGLNDHQLKIFFVKQAGVGLSPGSLFGEPGSGFMRMNLAAPRQVIATALKQISIAMQS